MNILLTGGRAPVTLDLARFFHKAGHTVYVAESLSGHLSQPSWAVRASFHVPPPRQQTGAFLQALKEIILRQAIDLLVPTCEEVFYVSMGRAQLPCRVFVEPIEKLRKLHNKQDFILLAQALGLPVPQTMLIEGMDDLLAAYERWPRLVLKPAYSRFSARTLVLPTVSQAFSTLMLDPASPWVAQQFMDGSQVCTYSLCHAGRVAAHSAYRSEFTAGLGATVHFRHVEHPAAFAWVRTFAAATAFTGQVAFDFIEASDGQIHALECNPRATSGAHLFSRTPGFVERFFAPSESTLTPAGDVSPMLATAMLLYALPAAVHSGQIKKWASAFFSGRDVIFKADDPLPFFLQFRSILHYIKLGREYGLTPLAASTHDIEWNG